MRKFHSLTPSGLPDSYDAEKDGAEPHVKVVEAEGAISISYSFPGVYLADSRHDVDGRDTDFTLLDMPDVGTLRESGLPELPSFGRYVQIPARCSYRYTVEKGTPVELHNVVVRPAQAKLMDQPATAAFEFDKGFYKKDELYPRDIVEVSGPFEVDGYRALLVHVRPFQYNPARKYLQGHGDITVKITLEQSDDEDVQPYVDDEVDLRGFGNLILNPRRDLRPLLGARIKPLPLPPVLRWQGPELLIIHHPDFKSAALKLARWKEQRGTSAETVSIATVGNEPSTIKAYIRNRRKQVLSRLRYVLLLGDVDHIKPEPAQFDSNQTDYYYSTKEDPSSATDFKFPWLAIGRIPVRTESEAIDVVDQIIGYEKDPPGAADYYRRMTFAGFFQDDTAGTPGSNRDDRRYVFTMEAIRQHLVSLGYDVDRIYVTNNPAIACYENGTAIPSDVLAAIVTDAAATQMLVAATTEGQLVVGHRDHGNWDGWVHPSFRKGNLDAVTGSMPSLFFSINCQTGRFDYPSATQSQQECFAENLLRIKRGAPSLVAATRNSGTWRNDDLEKALFDALWPGVLPTFPGTTYAYPIKHGRLGDMLNYAKCFLPINHSGDASGIRHHCEIYHVLGDPSLEIWTEQPRTVAMNAWIPLPQLPVGQTKLNIKLTACPADSVITVMFGDKVLKRVSPHSTNITIPLRDLRLTLPSLPTPPRQPLPHHLRRSLQVCFHAPGYRYTEARVQV